MLDQEKSSVIWKPREQPTDSVFQSIPKIISDILVGRGLRTEEQMQRWLNPSLRDLRDPYSLTGMREAVDRLLLARKRRERICIYADYDLDGTSGLALLLKALPLLGFENLIGFQPKRLSEGYGLKSSAISKLKREEEIDLILTVDLGITAVVEVDYAQTLGIDVIVTDHHLPKEELPRAVALVNPNQGDCGSGLGHLCGAGVAFYLVLALKRELQKQNLLQKDFDAKDLLDCFAIGTLTDMVPLIEENRVLVKHGLHVLAQTSRPGLQALLEELGLWGRPLSSQDVAIRFAPKLNALSRMETGVQPLDLYQVEDKKEARRLVTDVLSNNQNRQASQKQAEQEAIEFVEQTKPQNVIFVFSKNFHRGVIGLVATKLTQLYKIPAFVGALGESGQIVGSARMPAGYAKHLLDAMETCHDVLHQFGGHAMAAGFELDASQAEAFRLKLDAYFKPYSLAKRVSIWLYDVEARLSDFTSAFMSWYDHLGPFGTQFETPRFLLAGVTVQEVRELNGGHLRLNIEQDQIKLTALWFTPDPEHRLLRQGLKKGQRLQALVEPQWNFYQGRKSVQLLVHDLRPIEN